MSTRDLAHVALFAAIVAALGLFPPVSVPFVPVPVTMQTLGVMLAGSLLGARRGALSLLVFLVVVAVGVPVLAGGRGGMGAFVSPSGGFLLGFPLGAFVAGWLTERRWERYTFPWAVMANALGGILAVYAVGIPFLALVGDVPPVTAAVGSLVFLPGDLIKVGIASSVAVTARRAYPLLQAP